MSFFLLYAAVWRVSGADTFNCHIAEGTTFSLSAGTHSCASLQVDGTFQMGDNTHLTAEKIVVSTTGTFQIGSEAQPAQDVELFLDHSDCSGLSSTDSCWEKGQFTSEGTTSIFGQPKTSWALLIEDTAAGSNVIAVEECVGWAVGDPVVITATGGDATSFSQVIQSRDNYESEERTIAVDLGSCRFQLDSALNNLHRGQWLDNIVPTQAEVLNMKRSVTITGPEPYPISSDPWDGFQGILTRQQNGGVMDIRYTHVENCGRIGLGLYCLHFHLVGVCPTCRFEGNVVEKGINKGITVHGTHRSVVTRNVLYGLRGAFLYLEDGNEYENEISYNVISCPTLSNFAPLGGMSRSTRCSLNGISEHEEGDFTEQSGIYSNSPNNDLIGNRVSNMENAFFIGVGRVWGDGYAEGLVCKEATRFGITSGNNFHNNCGFGWYINKAFPTNVQTDADGLVSDWNSCLPFNMQTGEDQATNAIVENHVEYFHTFSMGVYDMGDVSFQNVVSAMNQNGLYWKTYRRGPNSAPFCSGCTFYNNVFATAAMGGSALVEFENSSFLGNRARIQINHHCGLLGAHGTEGGMCASHYLFHGSVADGSFAEEPEFITETEGSNAESQTDALIFFDGHVYFDTAGAHPTFDTTGCTQVDSWTKCPASWDVRNVRIYSPNRGDLTIVNEDESGSYSIPSRTVEKYVGFNSYTPGCSGSGPQTCSIYAWPSGYTFLVRASQTLAMTVPTYTGVMDDLFTAVYSEQQLAATQFNLRVSGDPKFARASACTVSSTHNRQFLTPYGPLVPQTGFWWDCKADDGHWTTYSGVDEFVAALPLPTSSGGNTGAGCEASCVGLTFTDDSHAGQSVCDAELCGDSVPWVSTSSFGCSSEPFSGNCCDTRTCSGDFTAEPTAADSGNGDSVVTTEPTEGASGCTASCVGLTFSDSSHSGQDVCTAELCGDSVPYVSTTNFGCSSNPTAFSSNCCDTRTCSGDVATSEPTVAVVVTNEPTVAVTSEPTEGASGCTASCVGLTFSDSSHAGQDVCTAELCGDSVPYVSTTNFGCSSNPTAFSSNCCDTRTCSGDAVTSEPTSATAEPTEVLGSTGSLNIGFALSLGLMSNKPSYADVANSVTAAGVSKFRLYGWSDDPQLISAILAVNPSAKFIIEVIPSDVNACATDCAPFLSSYAPYASSITEVAIGNEPLHAGSAATFSLLPTAYSNVVTLLNTWGWNARVTIPFSMHALQNTWPPSNGNFQEPNDGGNGCANGCSQSQVGGVMHQLLTLMQQDGGVFALHPYPYFVAAGDTSLLAVSLDADTVMQNQYDSCVAAMSKLGFSNIPIIITETGWATAGTSVATVDNAATYVNSLTTSQLASQTDIYVFEFFDEANKSGAADEPNFGWYTEAGARKFEITALGTPEPTTSNTTPVQEVPSTGDCSQSCVGLVFTDSSHDGQSVCAAELCPSTSAPYVSTANFGCASDVSTFSSDCCDTRTCNQSGRRRLLRGLNL